MTTMSRSLVFATGLALSSLLVAAAVPPPAPRGYELTLLRDGNAYTIDMGLSADDCAVVLPILTDMGADVLCQ